MATVSISPSPPFASLLISAPRSLSCSSLEPCNPTLPLASSAIFRPAYQSRRRLGRILRRRDRSWRAPAAGSGDALPSESAVEKAQQIVPAAADGFSSSTIISALLTAAFVGLSLLTIGVIYLAVQDFLQKRETDKFEKEEAAKKKKGGKKAKVKARSGPRGFGQKIEEDDD